MSVSEGGSGGLSLNGAINAALTVSAARGERAYIVGGVVRDLVMGRPVGDYDLDLVIEGDGEGFAAALHERLGGEIAAHRTFLTCKLRAPFGVDHAAANSPLISEIDIVTARSEAYPRPGALPQVVASTIEDDLLRRDFSCNAMALSLAAYQRTLTTPGGAVDGALLAEWAGSGDLIDPCQGLGDIARKLVRVLHPESFVDDPTRLFRALRYVTRLGFTLEPSTEEAFRLAVSEGALGSISVRRVWNEVAVILDEERAFDVLRDACVRGLFDEFPVLDREFINHLKEPLEYLAAHRGSLAGEDRLSAGKLLFFAAALWAGRKSQLIKFQEPRALMRAAQEIATSLRGGATGLEFLDYSDAQLLVLRCFE